MKQGLLFAGCCNLFDRPLALAEATGLAIKLNKLYNFC